VARRPRVPFFVVVSGPPASGKSTIAPEIARHLGLPLLAKDTIKEALMTALGAPDIEASRRLGFAAFMAQFALAADTQVGAVLEGTFHRSITADALRDLPGPVIEVFCRCTREEAARRYAARAGTRHAGHFDQERTTDHIWTPDIAEPVAGGWAVVEVDTNTPVDLDAILASIDQHVRALS
jgi:predicted kinase